MQIKSNSSKQSSLNAHQGMVSTSVSSILMGTISSISNYGFQKYNLKNPDIFLSKIAKKIDKKQNSILSKLLESTKISEVRNKNINKTLQDSFSFINNGKVLKKKLFKHFAIASVATFIVTSISSYFKNKKQNI